MIGGATVGRERGRAFRFLEGVAASSSPLSLPGAAVDLRFEARVALALEADEGAASELLAAVVPFGLERLPGVIPWFLRSLSYRLALKEAMADNQQICPSTIEERSVYGQNGAFRPEECPGLF